MIANALDRAAGGPDDNSAQANHLIAGPLTHRYGKGVNTTMDDGAMVTHTLTARGYDASEDGTGRGTPQAVTTEGVRRLTPVECERLQGFPDGWTIPDGTDWREHPKPDGPRYAQMGNAVTVPVAEWIGRRLAEVAA